MPPGEFCVFRGLTQSSDGPVCSDDAVVIWSTHAAHAPQESLSTAPFRHVYFGFVEMPSFLLHAVAKHRMRARLVDYSDGPEQLAVPIEGISVLGGPSLHPRTLTMTLPAPLTVSTHDDACVFDSYRGVFIGVIGASRRGSARRGLD
jgi:hypothetical protein